MIPQNKALDESFSEELVRSSKKVNKGQKLRKKTKKGQILIIPKSRQIIPQNEALDKSFSKKVVSGSKKVIIGQKFRKWPKKV